MPQDYSVLEDQATPNLMPPPAGGQPMDEVPVPNAKPNFADQFEQMIMQQLQESNPEAIKKKMLQEHLSNLGITDNPDSFGSRLKRGLYEANKVYESQKAGTPYTGLNERLQHASQAEYEKSFPLIKASAETLAKDIRERQKGVNSANVQGLKNDASKYKVDSMERLGISKNEIASIVAQAQAGDKNAKARLTNLKTDIIEQGEKNFPGYANLDPQSKQDVNNMLLKNSLGEMYGSFLNSIQASTLAHGKMPDNSMNAFQLPEPERQGYNEEDLIRNQNRKAGKWQPAGGGGLQFLNVEGKDALGNVVKKFAIGDKRAGTVRELDGPAPVDQKKIDTDRAFAQGQTQASASLGDTIAAVQDNREKEFTGPGEGNPLSKLFRVWGVSNDKGAYESMRDILAKNASLLHTKAMAGGTRYAMQMAKDMENNLATSGPASAKSLLYGLGALKYSIELGRLDQQGRLSDADISNTLMTRVKNSLDEMTKKAYADQTWNRIPGHTKRQTKIILPSIEDLIKQDKEQVGVGAAGPRVMTPAEAAKYVQGLPKE